MVFSTTLSEGRAERTLALEEGGMAQKQQQIQQNGEFNKSKSVEPLTNSSTISSTISTTALQNGQQQQQWKPAVNGAGGPVEEANKGPEAVGPSGGTGQNGLGRKVSVDCIEILDDDDEEEDDEIRVIEEPLPKRPRTTGTVPEAKRQEMGAKSRSSPVPEDPKNSNNEPIPAPKSSAPSTSAVAVSAEKADQKEEAVVAAQPKLTSYSDLLGRLDEYVANAIDSGQNVERKVLEALLAAINVQVQKEPYSVRKLILDKQLVLPNTISLPPSQVVEMVVEHDPEHQLSRVINRLFGEDRPKLTDTEKREKQLMKALNPAPNMTKLLLEIGQDLVQECTYYDIVHAKNLPEQPKNMETYKQVAAQLKPVWEALKAKNAPYKLKTFSCPACGFKTDSRTVLNEHKQQLHYIGRRFQCTYCPEFDTNEYRISQHILEEHGVKPMPQDQQQMGVLCPICEEEFHYKVQRDHHLKMCRRDVHKLRTIQAGRAPEDINMVNRWLWDKPPTEPSILQQEAQQRQQQLRQQQMLLQQQKLQQQQTLAAAAFAAKQRMPRQRKPAPSTAPTPMLSGSLLATRFALPQASNQAQQAMARSLMAQAQQRMSSMVGGTSTGKQQQQHQPSVGEILRLAQGLTAQQLQAAMQAQAVQMAKSQQLQQKSQQILAAASSAAAMNRTALAAAQKTGAGNSSTTTTASAGASGTTRLPTKPAVFPTPLPRPLLERNPQLCEICDFRTTDCESLRLHMQSAHRQLMGKSLAEMLNGPPLVCSRCQERFWTYEGLERHLVMAHGLVTANLLTKAQQKKDSGKCKLCGKQYAFNVLQHLIGDHAVKLCSVEIMYSCDMCSFKCSSYQTLEEHLTKKHPKS